MKKIPANMVKVDDRTIITQGTSLAVSLPPNILREFKVEKGDMVTLYNNGKGQLLIDLVPDQE